MTLGDYIKDYRSKNCLSQFDFAKMVGISKAYISILERNINPSTGKPAIPSLSTINRIAKATGIDFNEFLLMLDGNQLVSLDPEDSDTLAPEDMPVYREYRELPGDDQETVRQIVHVMHDRRKKENPPQY